MGFTDALKRSLGFEEDTSLNNKQPNNYKRQSFSSRDFGRSNNNVAPDLSSNGYYDGVSISPEQSFYEIMLIRPRTIDDINYVVDQIVEKSNPVILDLSFLEKESPANFKLAGDKIKQMRSSCGAEALLLAHCNDKNLVIVAPKGVSLVRK